LEAVGNKKLIAFILLGLGTASSAFALTWRELRSKALEKAPVLETSKADIKTSDAAISSAQAQFLPNITSNLSAYRSLDSNEDVSFNKFDAGITLEQSLFSFGKSTAQLEAARSGKSASLAKLKLSSVTLRSKLAKAWAKALYLQELAKISEKNVTRREANVQIVKLRYQGGRENKGSVLKTETATLQSKTDTQEAKANYELAKGDLSVLIGEDIASNETFTGEIVPEIKLDSGNTKNDHPEITALEAKQKQAEASLTESRRHYLPDLSLSASAKKSASPDLPLKDPQYSAGVTLKVPLFNPSTSAEIEAASAKKHAAIVALQEAKASHTQKLKTAASNLDFARQRLTVAIKSFEASKLQAEVSRQRYTLGLMSFQDWDSYEAELMRSESAVLTAKLDVANAYADYNEALGMSLEEGP
jgi:outer membrane protein TolC